MDSNASTATPTTANDVEPSKTNDSTAVNGTANGVSVSDNGGKFENISDNGSEISDEGYRSLGLIQQANNNQSKRTSLHSQTSIEDGKIDDAKTNGMFSIVFWFVERFLSNVLQATKSIAWKFP